MTFFTLKLYYYCEFTPNLRPKLLKYKKDGENNKSVRCENYVDAGIYHDIY